MSDDHAEYVLAQINEDLRAENKKLRGEIKDDRQGAIDHLEDALYRAQTENEKLKKAALALWASWELMGRPPHEGSWKRDRMESWLSALVVNAGIDDAGASMKPDEYFEGILRKALE